jgi:hypothetical protein
LKLKTRLLLVACCSLISARLFASQLTGTVTNGTTGKPAAGAEVTLLSLAGGMEPVGNAKSDSRGHYSINVSDAGGQLLLRAAFQGVNYHQRVPPGATSVDITVYDADKKVSNILGEGRILRVQTVGGELEVSEMFSLRNESTPPKTQMSDRSFEFVLPEGATITEGMAKGSGGMAVNSAPVPLDEKNHYAFIFPLRPGPTQFQVVYKLPYKGSRDFNITADLPLAELGVMLPKSMTFKEAEGRFAQATDEAGMTVYVAKSLTPGQSVKFTLSGEGPAPNPETAGGPPQATGGRMGDGRSSEASSSVSWYVIGGVLLIIFGGAFLAMRKKKTSQTAEDDGPTQRPPMEAGGRAPARTKQKSAPPGTVLDALKEELFQLESDRLEGKISQQEYEKAKAGLDVLLRRQMQ